MKMRSLIYGLIFISNIFLFSTNASGATTIDLNLPWIYYQDNSGREINYDFSDAVLDQYGWLQIPGHAVNAPPSESGTTFLWSAGFRNQKVAVNNGIYHMSIPHATDSLIPIQTAAISVDGTTEDWNNVSIYLEDNLPDVRVGPVASADVNYIKLAYSLDYSKLYALIKLGDVASQNVWYRLFLDKDLDGDLAEPGDYQIDVRYVDSSWDIVSQGWDSFEEADWYLVEENGVVSVSGDYIEISVDSNAFNLPENLNLYGHTIQNTSPYEIYDWFYTDFLETGGFSSLGAYNAAAPFPTEWQFSARFSGLRNHGFGQSSPYLHWYRTSVGVGSHEPNDLEPRIEAVWVNGHYMGTDFNDALVLEASINNDLDTNDAYYWQWFYPDNNGIVIEGLDVNTTALDLKIEVTNAGQSASFYYRLNSDDPVDWQLAVTHNLPIGVGTMYGFYDVFPTIGMGSGFWISNCDFNKDGSIDFSDFASFALAWLSERGEGNWNHLCDVSEIKDGAVNGLDLSVFAENWLFGTVSVE
jgi:hypothetical protein